MSRIRSHRHTRVNRKGLAGAPSRISARITAMVAFLGSLCVGLVTGTPLVVTFGVAPLVVSQPANAQSFATDLAFDIADLDFVLKQIEFAERHAAGEELLDILPNATIPWGLRTVDGSFNNLVPGQENFGRADEEFSSVVNRSYPDAQNGTSYTQGASPSTDPPVPASPVFDSTPRLISHLIVNQSVENPAAVAAADANEDSSNIGPDITGIDQLKIPNVAVDEGLSAPFNAFTTFFGQFYDHGLDLINKGGNSSVFMPLQPDDPLFDAGLDGLPETLDDNGPNIMILTRATLDAGPDGEIGTDDDVSAPINATTPHVDQQQTYASHTSPHVLLREYRLFQGAPRATGRLLNGRGLDGVRDRLRPQRRRRIGDLA